MIIFAAYRSWAIKALKLALPLAARRVSLVNSPNDLDAVLESRDDVEAIFLAGWSWILPAKTCKDHLIVGMHPSDLPDYAGGSPIQHQILDGLTQTRATLFRVTEDVDAGPCLIKEPLNLDGSLQEVFDRLSVVTARLYLKFESSFCEHPTLDEPPEDVGAIIRAAKNSQRLNRRRLSPQDGRLAAILPGGMTARGLYNFIRCREATGNHLEYEHSYYEDETGKVLFTGAKFQGKEPKNS